MGLESCFGPVGDPVGVGCVDARVAIPAETSTCRVEWNGLQVVHLAASDKENENACAPSASPAEWGFPAIKKSDLPPPFAHDPVSPPSSGSLLRYAKLIEPVANLPLLHQLLWFVQSRVMCVVESRLLVVASVISPFEAC